VIFAGPRRLLVRADARLKDPLWGVWLGRKSCIPAEIIVRGLFNSEKEALRQLVGDQPIEEFTRVTDVHDFSEGTDSLNDQPLSFGDGKSSGVDARRFGVRRIALKPASERSKDGRQDSPSGVTL